VTTRHELLLSAKQKIAIKDIFCFFNGCQLSFVIKLHYCDLAINLVFYLDLLNNMGRGLAWDAIERQIAAKAYVSASENNINGADQRTSTFADTIHRYVIEYMPLDADPKRFSGRDPKRILTFLKKDVMPDVQKFSAAIGAVQASLNTVTHLKMTSCAWQLHCI
jgi:hypothetical protein